MVSGVPTDPAVEAVSVDSILQISTVSSQFFPVISSRGVYICGDSAIYTFRIQFTLALSEFCSLVAICTPPLQYTRHIPDALFDRRVSLRAPRVRSSLLSVSQWQYSRSLITSLSAVTDLCEGRVN